MGDKVKYSKNFIEFITKDLELLRRLSDFTRKNKYLSKLYSNVVSKHPWSDICLLVWIGCIVSIIELGKKHMWVIIFNLVASYFLQQAIRARRPTDYDLAYKPLADSLADSFGFPSLESYMSVVLTGHVFMVTRSVVLLILMAILTVIIGLSRIFALSRFPHQIIGSWLVGFLGLTIAEYYCERHQIHKFHAHAYGSMLGIFALSVLIVFALSIESNDSRLMGVSKKTFKDVILQIMNSSKDTGYTADKKFVDEDNNGDGAGIDGGFRRAPEPEVMGLSASEVERQRLLNSTPRTAALKRAIESEMNRNRKKKEFLKRDSFYFLQRTLERREAETERLRNLKYRNTGNIFDDADFPTPREYDSTPTTTDNSTTTNSSNLGYESPRSDNGNKYSERSLA